MRDTSRPDDSGQGYRPKFHVFTKKAHPCYHTPYYDSLVAKMLACGNPDKMGYLEYRCPHCGQGTHRVAMSCKSSLCLRCAKVYVDNWVSQVSQMLHEGVIYPNRAKIFVTLVDS